MISLEQMWQLLTAFVHHVPWRLMSPYQLQQTMSQPGWQERVARRLVHMIEHDFPAFPEVPSEEVLRIHRKLEEDPELVRQMSRVLRGTHEIVSRQPLLLAIDRTKPFDPVAFIRDGWKIEEQDERSLALTEVNLFDVQFKMMLEGRETYVNGEEKLKRLKKAGHIRLDAKVFQTLWENQYLIPERWKEKTNGKITCIYFDGTVLRHPDGNRCVLNLYWDGSEWGWGVGLLDLDWRVNSTSAVLEMAA